MASIDDLIAQVAAPRVREQLRREWAEVRKTRQFGLVFDRHLPELVPLPKVTPRRGDLVAKKGASFTDHWRVRRVRVSCRPHSGGDCPRITVRLWRLASRPSKYLRNRSLVDIRHLRAPASKAQGNQANRKNLALAVVVKETLRKPLNDQVRSRSKSNVSECRKFSERLEDAIARYHTNAISTVEVLQELIDLAKELRAAQARGEEEGLSEDELAFYDALAENQSAVEVLGNDQLKVIAHELLVKLQGNITVDWAHRENARAKMRVLVKRILRKYGYPPDLQAAAVQTVLAQAEVWSAEWVR